MAVLLTDLSAGHTFDSISFTADAERSRAYRDATGDTLAVYESAGFVPPLAVAAFALGALLEYVTLPEGTLHINESMQLIAPVPIGAALECRATLAQRSVRAGMVVSILNSDILLDGRSVITTRASVMSPAS